MNMGIRNDTNGRGKLSSLALTASAVILIDQIIKFFVEKNMYGFEVPIIKDIFSFTYVQNTGAAWGILSEYDFILKLLTPVLIAVILIYLLKMTDRKSELIFGGLIIGGAIGNYIDRIFRGYVIDFMDFKVWPVFNFADICIVIGCIAVIIKIFPSGGNNN